MTIALIQKSPPTILQTYEQATINVNIPGLWQAYSVGVGWSTPDGAYAIVAVPDFVPPSGKVAVGSPTFSIDADGNVTQTFDVADPPAPAPLTVSSLGFIGLFTAAEAVAVTTAAETDPQIALFMAESSAAGMVTLNDTRVQAGLAYLVSKNLITADRASAITAGNPPPTS